MPQKSDPTTAPSLAERAAELRKQLPELRRQAAQHPGGVSPAYAHALKRVERWEAGDARPVIVTRLSDGRVFAQAVAPGSYEDGQVVEARAVVRGGA